MSFWSSITEKMAFNSLSEFLAMGKHGIHVWMSYGFFVLCLVILLVSLFRETASLEKELKREGLLDDTKTEK